MKRLLLILFLVGFTLPAHGAVWHRFMDYVLREANGGAGAKLADVQDWRRTGAIRVDFSTSPPTVETWDEAEVGCPAPTAQDLRDDQVAIDAVNLAFQKKRAREVLSPELIALASAIVDAHNAAAPAGEAISKQDVLQRFLSAYDRNASPP